MNGFFDLDGELPVNPDGGLKSFGHPIGASGLRMLFECWLQLRGEAGKRQIASVGRGRKLALTHNLGGAPGECVSFVGVVGSVREPLSDGEDRPTAYVPGVPLFLNAFFVARGRAPVPGGA